MKSTWLKKVFAPFMRLRTWRNRNEGKMALEAVKSCPEKELLRAYFYQRLFGRANEYVLQHIKICGPCLSHLASLQASNRQATQPPLVHRQPLELARRA